MFVKGFNKNILDFLKICSEAAKRDLSTVRVELDNLFGFEVKAFSLPLTFGFRVCPDYCQELFRMVTHDFVNSSSVCLVKIRHVAVMLLARTVCRRNSPDADYDYDYSQHATHYFCMLNYARLQQYKRTQPCCYEHEYKPCHPARRYALSALCFDALLNYVVLDCRYCHLVFELLRCDFV